MDNTILGFDEYDSIVQTLPVPQAKATSKVEMGYSKTSYYQVGAHAGTFSVWTDSVGPCHVVLIHGKPRNGPLGLLGIAHVSGTHQTICQEAEALLKEMEKTCDCEVFIIGGQKEWIPKGYTFDASTIPSALQGKVKLVITPASSDGFIKVELTGARKINLTEHT